MDYVDQRLNLIAARQVTLSGVMAVVVCVAE